MNEPVAVCYTCTPGCRCIEDDCTLNHDPKPLLTASQVTWHRQAGHEVRQGEIDGN